VAGGVGGRIQGRSKFPAKDFSSNNNNNNPIRTTTGGGGGGGL